MLPVKETGPFHICTQPVGDDITDGGLGRGAADPPASRAVLCDCASVVTDQDDFPLTVTECLCKAIFALYSCLVAALVDVAEQLSDLITTSNGSF